MSTVDDNPKFTDADSDFGRHGTQLDENSGGGGEYPVKARTERDSSIVQILFATLEVAMPPLLAFTTRQVERLTGLSARVLRYWEETQVFRATHVDDQPGRAYRRLYTFRDVVGLRTLAMLRREHGVSLDELRGIGQYLSDRIEAPWASLKFQLVGRHIVFNDPASGFPVSGEPLGQRVIEFDLDEIARETEADAREFVERLPGDYGVIVRHRNINLNAWTIAGTRIPTSAILSFRDVGYSNDEIIREYPQVTTLDIEAAIAHEREARVDTIAG